MLILRSFLFQIPATKPVRRIKTVSLLPSRREKRRGNCSRASQFMKLRNRAISFVHSFFKFAFFSNWQAHNLSEKRSDAAASTRQAFSRGRFEKIPKAAKVSRQSSCRKRSSNYDFLPLENRKSACGLEMWQK